MTEISIIPKKKAKADTIKSMKKLGVYRTEYSGIIEIYAELIEQYTTITSRFMENDCNCTCSTSDGGEKKSPIVATIENLRKDLLQYSDRLMLNPKAHEAKSRKTEKKSTSLADVLKTIGGPDE